MMRRAQSYSVSELVNAKIKNPLVSNPMLIFYECLLVLLFLKFASHGRNFISPTFIIINDIIIYKVPSAFKTKCLQLVLIFVSLV